jgi:hypothetical protein
MPQILKNGPVVEPTIPANKMAMGQIGQVVDSSIGGYGGVVLVRIYEGLVAIVGNKVTKPFSSTWTESCGLPVRILKPHEVVELSND